MFSVIWRYVLVSAASLDQVIQLEQIGPYVMATVPGDGGGSRGKCIKKFSAFRDTDLNTFVNIKSCLRVIVGFKRHCIYNF